MIEGYAHLFAGGGVAPVERFGAKGRRKRDGAQTAEKRNTHTDPLR